jgi:hypothetical protein
MRWEYNNECCVSKDLEGGGLGLQGKTISQHSSRDTQKSNSEQ